jgi:hypothetical protein
VAQGTPPPCASGFCACDDLFAPLTACFGLPFPANEEGQMPCLVVEATDDAPCTCNAPGRSPVPAEHMCAVSNAMASSTVTFSCFCEIDQASGPDLTSCQNDLQPTAQAVGWCYVDDTAATAMGNPELVKDCSSLEKHEVRFVGTGAPGPTANLFIACGQ